MGSPSWGAAAQRRAWGCKVPSDPTLLRLCDSVTSGRGWELFGHPSKRFVNRGPAVTSAAEPQFHSSNSQGSPKETQGTSGLAARSASRLNRSILPPPVIFRTFQLSQSRTPAALPTLTGAPPGAPHRGGTWRDGTWRDAPPAPGRPQQRGPGPALRELRQTHGALRARLCSTCGPAPPSASLRGPGLCSPAPRDEAAPSGEGTTSAVPPPPAAVTRGRSAPRRSAARSHHFLIRARRPLPRAARPLRWPRPQLSPARRPGAPPPPPLGGGHHVMRGPGPGCGSASGRCCFCPVSGGVCGAGG